MTKELKKGNETNVSEQIKNKQEQAAYIKQLERSLEEG